MFILQNFCVGTKYAVDAFSYGYVETITAYFLTHFHSDHYGGLCKSFNKPLYCTRITANLVKLKIKVSPEYIIVLTLNEPTLLEDLTTVTAIDSNHCPGAAMFLFKLKDGRFILHSGDTRAEDVVLKYDLWKTVQVDTLFLDTTYCDKKYKFPPQSQAIAATVECVRDHLAASNNKLLVVVGTYTIGKEKVFRAIAEEFDWKICVDATKLKVLHCLEDNALNARLTMNKSETPLHLIFMQSMDFQVPLMSSSFLYPPLN
ncbi:unnamed protein product [Soboliphyme baturini]|uniref:Lactamase_B domain-containing protein n=1 Tax=Soboliphyme baturini TaxID=241478 RepID=A0A183IJY1_9BILA|nr:unnamed protein product [Soboliphyme baturini]